MTNHNILCPACGAPNTPKAGMVHMTCDYCGVTLTIPEHLRTQAMPKMEKFPSKAKTVSSPITDAPDLIRMAQPIAIRAFNIFALWTWIRRVLPTCLVMFLLSILLCAAFAALPILLKLFR